MPSCTRVPFGLESWLAQRDDECLRTNSGRFATFPKDSKGSWGVPHQNRSQPRFASTESRSDHPSLVNIPEDAKHRGSRQVHRWYLGASIAIEAT